MRPEFNLVRVNAGQAMQQLKRKLDGYRSFGREIYIGVTTAPERRCEQHELNGWSRMVLLYEAFTAEIARTLECDLIDYARRCNFRLPPGNVCPGGEGIGSRPGSHYLYLLLA